MNSNPEKAKAFQADLTMAIAAVMAKHSLYSMMVEVSADPDTSSLIVKMTPAAKSANVGKGLVTKNAVLRYKASMHKLGLPALGTKVKLVSGSYTILGLSSDAKRVKAVLDGATVSTDLQLDVVVSVIKNIAAKSVAAIAAKDEVGSVEEAAIALKNLFNKPAP